VPLKVNSPNSLHSAKQDEKQTRYKVDYYTFQTPVQVTELNERVDITTEKLCLEVENVSAQKTFTCKFILKYSTGTLN